MDAVGIMSWERQKAGSASSGFPHARFICSLDSKELTSPALTVANVAVLPTRPAVWRRGGTSLTPSALWDINLVSLLMLAPFMKHPLKAVLKGVTNDPMDFSGSDKDLTSSLTSCLLTNGRR
ncbi:uncharacterized protein ACWYII_037914 isoform 2-T2 [Salvelinus alpinus]